MKWAVRPNKAAWFWAAIAAWLCLATGVVLQWHFYHQYQAQLPVRAAASAEALAIQIGHSESLLQQAIAAADNQLPKGVIEVEAKAAGNGSSWRVKQAALPGGPKAGDDLANWAAIDQSKSLAAVLAARSGVFLARAACVPEAACQRWLLSYLPVANWLDARTHWQLLQENNKQWHILWPSQAKVPANPASLHSFTIGNKHLALGYSGAGWSWPTSFAVLVMSLCLGVLTGLGFWLRQTIQELVRERSRTQAIEEVCEEALFTIKPDGKVSSWGRGAILLWEYGPREIIGQPVLRLFGEGLAEAMRPLAKAKAARGIEIKAKNASGREFNVLLHAVPILNERAQAVGAALSVTDLRPIQTAQTRLLAQEKILTHNMGLLEKNAERCYSLEQARRHLQTVLDAVPFIIGYWDKNQINQVANRAHGNRFGVEPADIPGMTLQELLKPEDYEEQFGRIQAVLAGMPQTYEYTVFNDESGAFNHYLGQYLPDTTKTGVRGFYVIEQDITELVEGNLRLGQALEENDVLLTTINNQLLYSVTDADGVILDVNDNYCAALGFERSQLLGQTHRLVNSGVHSAQFWQDLWSCLMAGKPWRAEVCNRTQDGRECWFDTVIAPFHGQQGKVEKCVALSIDITSRKAVEQEHQRLGQLLRDVLAAASEVAIIATDTQGAITLFNQGAQSMLGYDPEEVLGEHPVDYFYLPAEVADYEAQIQHPEALLGFALMSAQALELGPQTRQWTFVRKDTSQLKVSLTLSAMRDLAGSLVGYLLVAADITESLQQQQAILSAKDQLLAAAQVAELGVWEYLPGHGQLHWNERMFEIFGRSVEDPPDSLESWFSCVHEDEFNPINALFEQALAGAADFSGVFRFHTPQGQLRYVQFGAYFERDLTGQVFKVTGISRDITGQQELENQLRQAKEEADAANIAKSQFLANMSHEIRTPMNAVLGMLQLVGQTPLGLRQQDYVNKAQTAAKSLLGLLNDILDFSKIDAGKLVIDPVSTALADLCTDVAVVMAGNQGDKPVEVIFDLDPELPERVMVDKLRVQQVLINLIGNALKFTAQGHVWVQLTCLTLSPGHALVHFCIRDTGIGIRQEQQSRIFDGFVQAESSTTRRFGGTGLGLVITKNLIELMGGELTLVSEFGQGSEFSFNLNLALADTTALTTQASLPGGRILLVHENPIALQVLERDLTCLGFEVTSAHGEADALSLAEGRARAGEYFTLALVNWRMSSSNGLALGKQLHQINAKPLQVVLLLTQREKEQLAQYQDHDARYLWQLSKPIVRPALEQVLRLALAGDKAPPKQQDASQVLTGISILVVEDNALNRQVAAELLGGLGAKISLAVDGADGLSKASAPGAHYDVILMDLQMPNMDGLEATRHLRLQGLTLPIIAMTANASAEDKEDCLDAGMDDHLSKPIDLNQVVSAILHALHRSGTQAGELASAGIEAPEDDVIEGVEGVVSELISADEQHWAEQLSGESLLDDELMAQLLADGDSDAAVGRPENNLAGIADADGSEVQQGPEDAETQLSAQFPELFADELAAEPESESEFSSDLELIELESETVEPEPEPEPEPESESEPTEADTAAEDKSAPAEQIAPTSPADWVDDLDEILRRFGGKRALFQKMLANLGPETQRLVGQLQIALIDMDRPAAITAAHSIKGTAATLGAKALSNRAAWLEKRLKTTDVELTSILTNEAFAALDEALNAALAAFDEVLAA